MPRSAYAVTNFITKNTTIKEFYNFVTQNGTDFSYDIDAPGRCGWTALQSACDKGNLELTQALINMGAYVNGQRHNSYTPLYDAINNGNLEMVKMLIKHDASIYDEFGSRVNANNYISLAVSRSSDESISSEAKKELNEIRSYLIQFASKNLKELVANKLKYDPSFYAASRDTRPDAVLPQDCIELIEGMPQERKSEIHEANRHEIYETKGQIKRSVKDNNLTQLENLLSTFTFDAKLLFVDMSDSLSRVAAMHGNLEMIKLLVKHGDYVVDSGHTSGESISVAARNAGHHEIADYLDNLQNSRYGQLLNDANEQEQHNMQQNTFLLGMFFDKNSSIYQGITQYTRAEDATRIAKNIVKYIQ